MFTIRRVVCIDSLYVCILRPIIFDVLGSKIKFNLLHLPPEDNKARILHLGYRTEQLSQNCLNISYCDRHVSPSRAHVCRRGAGGGPAQPRLMALPRQADIVKIARKVVNLATEAGDIAVYGVVVD